MLSPALGQETILPALKGKAMKAARLCMMGAWGGVVAAAVTWGNLGSMGEVLPPQLGNRPAIISQLEHLPSDRPLSFAVVGDSHGSETFDEILRELREKGVDFIVHLGDFAAAPNREGHRLFVEQVRRGLGSDGPPMLIVMGNHDVDAGFPVQAFEELYGPSSYSFRIGENLFVVVRNCLPRTLRDGRGATRTWGDEVRRAIQERGSGVRRTFLFMHAPPMDPLGPMDPLRAGRFEAKWGGLGINYLVAGHLHQYSRTEIGSTVLLVSGGGGGRLRMVRSGRFHHAVIIRVAGDQVTEELLVVEKAWAPLWRLHRAEVLGVSSLFSLIKGDVRRGERGGAAPGVTRAGRIVAIGHGGRWSVPCIWSVSSVRSIPSVWSEEDTGLSAPRGRISGGFGLRGPVCVRSTGRSLPPRSSASGLLRPRGLPPGPSPGKWERLRQAARRNATAPRSLTEDCSSKEIGGASLRDGTGAALGLREKMARQAGRDLVSRQPLGEIGV